VDAVEPHTASAGGHLPQNRICELLGIDIPILQAPMTYIAGGALAAAVSNAGALGIIETTTEQGRADLANVRTLTRHQVGANVALIMTRDPSLIDLFVEAGVTVVTTSAGDPSLFTGRLHDAGITVLHAVGTLRGALKAADAGVDGLIVDGVEGGGFKNRNGSSTMVLLPLVAARVGLPLIAAGGICDSVSMAAAMVLGADGVQMGTRMLASSESPVHGNFKEAIVLADDTATTLLSIPGSPTMRVLRSQRTERAGESRDVDGADLSSVLDLYFSGDMEASVANTGQAAGRIASVVPVAQIIEETWTGCIAALEGGRSRLGRTAGLGRRAR
jgi:enoyl-[acyl-carrier protein] reductase II